MMRFCFLVLALGLTGAAEAQSVIRVYDSFGPGGKSTPAVCVTGPDTSACGSATPRFWAYRFIPSNSGTLDHVDLALSYYNGTPGMIVTIVADNAGSPAGITPVLDTMTSAATPSYESAKAKIKFMSKLHPGLTAGTPYWIIVAPLGYDPLYVIQNDPMTSVMGLRGLSLDGGLTWSVGPAGVMAYDIWVTS